jgi:hypothetical protein
MVNDRALGLVSTKAVATAIVNGQLMEGSVLLAPDRTGTVEFAADKGDISRCGGSMRYTASNSGAIDLRCSDGTAVELAYTLLRETRGYAYGQTASGPVSLVFGMPPLDARAYLRPPSGRKIVENAEDGSLEIQ